MLKIIRLHSHLARLLGHEVAALFRDIDARLNGLVVALLLAGLELAAGGGAVLSRVLVALRFRNKSETKIFPPNLTRFAQLFFLYFFTSDP